MAKRNFVAEPNEYPLTVVNRSIFTKSNADKLLVRMHKVNILAEIREAFGFGSKHKRHLNAPGKTLTSKLVFSF